MKDNPAKYSKPTAKVVYINARYVICTSPYDGSTEGLIEDKFEM